MTLAIQSLGPPPEKHADRVVAELMKQLAAKHARLWAALNEIVNANALNAGSPRAQHKLEARLQQAGALTYLEPGKRGKYVLGMYSLVGWDPMRDAGIAVGDPIPA